MTVTICIMYVLFVQTRITASRILYLHYEGYVDKNIVFPDTRGGMGHGIFFWREREGGGAGKGVTRDATFPPLVEHV